MRKKKYKIQLPCILNFNSVLRFCYPNNFVKSDFFFFLVRHRIELLRKLPTMLSYFHPDCFVIVCVKEERGRKEFYK